MQADQLTRARLRRLAEFSAEQGQVVSVYMDLSPSEFAVPPARQTEIRSLLDEANRQLKQRDDLDHAEVETVKRDLDRVGEVLSDLSVNGAHGLALFCSSAGDGLLEVINLPRPVGRAVTLDRSPQIEPLAALLAPAVWGVVLVSRRVARIFRGSRDVLREVERFEDDTHGQHDQGGWSQARYQRSVDKEAHDHVRATAQAASARFRAAPLDSVLVGGPKELRAALIEALPAELRARVAGEIEVDVNDTNADDVLAAAHPVIAEKEREREEEALGRLRAGLGKGRAVGGLGEVLEATNERRVELVLVDEGFAAKGKVCPRCGSLWTDDVDRCLADDGELEPCDDVVEAAVERAIAQAADLLVLRDRPELGPHGGIAALLRF